MSLKRLLPLALAIICLMLAACGSTTPAVTQQADATAAPTKAPAATADEGEAAEEPAVEEPEGIDISKSVNLVGYLLGDELVGMSKVMAALNEKFTADINATMEIRYIGWGDMASKYPLVLASGDLDWIYTAPWAYYTQEAQKGAFYPLDTGMIEKYMPKHFAVLDPVAYDQVTIEINGEKQWFMICTSTPDKATQSFLIRKDLREKYGVAEFSRISDIEPYLAAIKENEPAMTPMMLDNTYDVKRPFGDQMLEQGMVGSDMYGATGSGLNIMYDWRVTTGEVFTLYEEPYRQAAIDTAKIVKSWYDAGYINPDVFGNTVRSKESFSQGKSAVAFGNSIDLQSNMATAVDNGWDIEIIPILLPDGKAARNAYTQNGVAIAATTKNVERVLMAMDLLYQDPDYVMLSYFGIEGENYQMTADGKVGMPEGVTNDTNTYPTDVAGFWFVSKDLQPPLESWTDSYIAHREALTDILINNPMNGFQTNKDATKTEEANCINVAMQYGQPLFIGAVADVDAAFAEMESKMQAAGFDKIVEEGKRQIAEFVAALK